MATLYNIAKSWASTHKTRDGGTWNQWCASLMVRFNSLPGAYPSAIIAYRASAIVSKDYTKAPVGAIHFWDIGEFGHVGQDLTGGGRTVLMASTKVETSWGTAIGVTGIHAYSVKTGAKYLGWSRKFGSMTVRHDAKDYGAVYSPAKTTEKTPTSSKAYKWVKPDKATQKAIQVALKKKKRYAGPADGAWATKSVMGIQETVRLVGYAGVIDGVAQLMTCHYVQAYAHKYGGYKGPMDNKLGPVTWAAFLKGLKK